MPEVSVIIPVYNTADYLRECVDSVISQTYKDLEILLIDDGSTDASPAICDEYAKKDNRVVVIHQKNGGRSVARNTGLDNAKGTYLLFVDSDDYITGNAVEKLVNAQKEKNADMVIFNFFGKLHKPFEWGEEVCSGHKAIDRIFRHIAYISPCTRFCHRKIYNGIRFPRGLNFEDTYKSADIILAAERIYNLDETLYFYREVETGITGSKPNVKHLDAFFAYENLYRLVKENKFEHCIPLAEQELLYFFVSMYGAFVPKTESEKQRRKEIAGKFIEYRPLLWQNASAVNKLAIVLLSVNPHLAHHTFRFYRYLVKEVLKK